MYTFSKVLPSLFAASVLTLTTALADPAPAATAQSAVGLSSQDGISISGLDVLVTRNGVTEKLSKELKLDSGVVVQPDGSVIGVDGTKILLRPNQVLTFKGELMNAPLTLGNGPLRQPTPAPASNQPTQATPEGTTTTK